MSLADQLTLVRVIAVPVVIVLFLADFHGHDYWATAVFIVAMATDWFDGRVARRRGRTSELGSLLDPVLRLAALERGAVMRARDLGKLKTSSQATAAAVGGFAAAGAWSKDVAWRALLIAVALTWLSGLDYARLAPGLLSGRTGSP